MDFINFFEFFLLIFEFFLFRAPRNQQLRKRLCPPELKLCLVPVEQRSTTSSLMLASKKNHPQPLPRPKNPQLKRVQPNRYQFVFSKSYQFLNASIFFNNTLIFSRGTESLPFMCFFSQSSKNIKSKVKKNRIKRPILGNFDIFSKTAAIFTFSQKNLDNIFSIFLGGFMGKSVIFKMLYFCRLF